MVDIVKLESMFGTPSTPVNHLVRLYKSLEASMGPAILSDRALLLELSCAADLAAFVAECGRV